MRKLRSKSKQLALSLTLLLSPLRSHASPNPEKNDEGIAIKTDQPAPFNGILLPLDVAGGLYENIETCEAELRIERSKCPAYIKIQQEGCEEKIKAVETAKKEQIGAYDKALKACELEAERAWYENPSLLLATGFAAGIATTVAVVFALGKALSP